MDRRCYWGWGNPYDQFNYYSSARGRPGKGVRSAGKPGVVSVSLSTPGASKNNKSSCKECVVIATDKSQPSSAEGTRENTEAASSTQQTLTTGDSQAKQSIKSCTDMKSSDKSASNSEAEKQQVNASDILSSSPPTAANSQLVESKASQTPMVTKIVDQKSGTPLDKSTAVVSSSPGNSQPAKKTPLPKSDSACKGAQPAKKPSTDSPSPKSQSQRVKPLQKLSSDLIKSQPSSAQQLKSSGAAAARSPNNSQIPGSNIVKLSQKPTPDPAKLQCASEQQLNPSTEAAAAPFKTSQSDQKLMLPRKSLPSVESSPSLEAKCSPSGSQTATQSRILKRALPDSHVAGSKKQPVETPSIAQKAQSVNTLHGNVSKTMVSHSSENSQPMTPRKSLQKAISASDDSQRMTALPAKGLNTCVLSFSPNSQSVLSPKSPPVPGSSLTSEPKKMQDSDNVTTPPKCGSRVSILQSSTSVSSICQPTNKQKIKAPLDEKPTQKLPVSKSSLAPNVQKAAPASDISHLDNQVKDAAANVLTSSSQQFHPTSSQLVKPLMSIRASKPKKDQRIISSGPVASSPPLKGSKSADSSSPRASSKSNVNFPGLPSGFLDTTDSWFLGIRRELLKSQSFSSNDFFAIEGILFKKAPNQSKNHLLVLPVDKTFPFIETYCKDYPDATASDIQCKMALRYYCPQLTQKIMEYKAKILVEDIARLKGNKTPSLVSGNSNILLNSTQETIRCEEVSNLPSISDIANSADTEYCTLRQQVLTDSSLSGSYKVIDNVLYKIYKHNAIKLIVVPTTLIDAVIASYVSKNPNASVSSIVNDIKKTYFHARINQMVENYKSKNDKGKSTDPTKKLESFAPQKLYTESCAFSQNKPGQELPSYLDIINTTDETYCLLRQQVIQGNLLFSDYKVIGNVVYRARKGSLERLILLPENLVEKVIAVYFKRSPHSTMNDILKDIRKKYYAPDLFGKVFDYYSKNCQTIDSSKQVLTDKPRDDQLKAVATSKSVSATEAINKPLEIIDTSKTLPNSNQSHILAKESTYDLKVSKTMAYSKIVLEEPLIPKCSSLSKKAASESTIPSKKKHVKEFPSISDNMSTPTSYQALAKVEKLTCSSLRSLETATSEAPGCITDLTVSVPVDKFDVKNQNVLLMKKVPDMNILTSAVSKSLQDDVDAKSNQNPKSEHNINCLLPSLTDIVNSTDTEYCSLRQRVLTDRSLCGSYTVINNAVYKTYKHSPVKLIVVPTNLIGAVIAWHISKKPNARNEVIVNDIRKTYFHARINQMVLNYKSSTRKNKVDDPTKKLENFASALSPEKTVAEKKNLFEECAIVATGKSSDGDKILGICDAVTEGACDLDVSNSGTSPLLEGHGMRAARDTKSNRGNKAASQTCSGIRVCSTVAKKTEPSVTISYSEIEGPLENTCKNSCFAANEISVKTTQSGAGCAAVVDSEATSPLEKKEPSLSMDRNSNNNRKCVSKADKMSRTVAQVTDVTPEKSFALERSSIFKTDLGKVSDEVTNITMKHKNSSNFNSSNNLGIQLPLVEKCETASASKTLEEVCGVVADVAEDFGTENSGSNPLVRETCVSAVADVESENNVSNIQVDRNTNTEIAKESDLSEDSRNKTALDSQQVKDSGKEPDAETALKTHLGVDKDSVQSAICGSPNGWHDTKDSWYKAIRDSLIHSKLCPGYVIGDNGHVYRQINNKPLLLVLPLDKTESYIEAFVDNNPTANFNEILAQLSLKYFNMHLKERIIAFVTRKKKLEDQSLSHTKKVEITNKTINLPGNENLLSLTDHSSAKLDVSTDSCYKDNAETIPQNEEEAPQVTELNKMDTIIKQFVKKHPAASPHQLFSKMHPCYSHPKLFEIIVKFKSKMSLKKVNHSGRASPIVTTSKLRAKKRVSKCKHQSNFRVHRSNKSGRFTEKNSAGNSTTHISRIKSHQKNEQAKPGNTRTVVGKKSSRDHVARVSSRTSKSATSSRVRASKSKPLANTHAPLRRRLSYLLGEEKPVHQAGSASLEVPKLATDSISEIQLPEKPANLRSESPDTISIEPSANVCTVPVLEVPKASTDPVLNPSVLGDKQENIYFPPLPDSNGDALNKKNDTIDDYDDDVEIIDVQSVLKENVSVGECDKNLPEINKLANILDNNCSSHLTKPVFAEINKAVDNDKTPFSKGKPLLQIPSKILADNTTSKTAVDHSSLISVQITESINCEKGPTLRGMSMPNSRLCQIIPKIGAEPELLEANNEHTSEKSATKQFALLSEECETPKLPTLFDIANTTDAEYCLLRERTLNVRSLTCEYFVRDNVLYRRKKDSQIDLIVVPASLIHAVVTIYCEKTPDATVPNIVFDIMGKYYHKNLPTIVSDYKRKQDQLRAAICSSNLVNNVKNAEEVRLGSLINSESMLFVKGKSQAAFPHCSSVQRCAKKSNVPIKARCDFDNVSSKRKSDQEQHTLESNAKVAKTDCHLLPSLSDIASSTDAEYCSLRQQALTDESLSGIYKVKDNALYKINRYSSAELIVVPTNLMDAVVAPYISKDPNASVGSIVNKISKTYFHARINQLVTNFKSKKDDEKDNEPPKKLDSLSSTTPAVTSTCASTLSQAAACSKNTLKADPLISKCASLPQNPDSKTTPLSQKEVVCIFENKSALSSNQSPTKIENANSKVAKIKVRNDLFPNAPLQPVTIANVLTQQNIEENIPVVPEIFPGAADFINTTDPYYKKMIARGGGDKNGYWVSNGLLYNKNKVVVPRDKISSLIEWHIMGKNYKNTKKTKRSIYDRISSDYFCINLSFKIIGNQLDKYKKLAPNSDGNHIILNKKISAAVPNNSGAAETITIDDEIESNSGLHAHQDNLNLIQGTKQMISTPTEQQPTNSAQTEMALLPLSEKSQNTSVQSVGVEIITIEEEMESETRISRSNKRLKNSNVIMSLNEHVASGASGEMLLNSAPPLSNKDQRSISDVTTSEKSITVEIITIDEEIDANTERSSSTQQDRSRLMGLLNEFPYFSPGENQQGDSLPIASNKNGSRNKELLNAAHSPKPSIATPRQSQSNNNLEQSKKGLDHAEAKLSSNRTSTASTQFLQSLNELSNANHSSKQCAKQGESHEPGNSAAAPSCEKNIEITPLIKERGPVEIANTPSFSSSDFVNSKPFDLPTPPAPPDTDKCTNSTMHFGEGSTNISEKPKKYVIVSENNKPSTVFVGAQFTLVFSNDAIYQPINEPPLSAKTVLYLMGIGNKLNTNAWRILEFSRKNLHTSMKVSVNEKTAQFIRNSNFRCSFGMSQFLVLFNEVKKELFDAQKKSLATSSQQTSYIKKIDELKAYSSPSLSDNSGGNTNEKTNKSSLEPRLNSSCKGKLVDAPNVDYSTKKNTCVLVSTSPAGSSKINETTGSCSNLIPSEKSSTNARVKINETCSTPKLNNKRSFSRWSEKKIPELPEKKRKIGNANDFQIKKHPSNEAETSAIRTVVLMDVICNGLAEKELNETSLPQASSNTVSNCSNLNPNEACMRSVESLDNNTADNARKTNGNATDVNGKIMNSDSSFTEVADGNNTSTEEVVFFPLEYPAVKINAEMRLAMTDFICKQSQPNDVEVPPPGNDDNDVFKLNCRNKDIAEWLKKLVLDLGKICGVELLTGDQVLVLMAWFNATPVLDKLTDFDIVKRLLEQNFRLQNSHIELVSCIRGIKKINIILHVSWRTVHALESMEKAEPAGVYFGQLGDTPVFFNLLPFVKSN